ncbi:MAG: glycoside hydrolase family 172 protein [Bryobacteraceae bacterium]|jgi:hypothetical protein
MDNKFDRRSLLAPATAAAAFGLGSLGKLQGAEEAPVSSDLLALARLRDYQTRRSSSYDRTGGNADFIHIDAGATATLLETAGPGLITHIWFTINSREDLHLKKLVLRAYWDGETEPSVEVPVGDFFGLGLGEYFLYQSALTSVAGQKALNAYFPMPFGASARVTVTNEGALRTDNFYYNIDYVTYSRAPADVGYFHAQYRQASPCHGWTDAWKVNWEPLVDRKKNLDGEGNYVFLEARGRGHFIGVTHAILQNQDGWFGEGDEMVFIDGQPVPAINGTGTEDYYNGAWDFGQTFDYMHNGAPYMVDAERVGGRYCLYRWHTESPVAFRESIRVTIEHGHANHRSDNFFSAAFWYQTEPHQKFPALPKVAERIPRIYRVGGPGPAPLPNGG